MNWVKSVTIVFDTRVNRKMLGFHNGKYQAVELRLRSDGKCFYMGKHSKVTLDGQATFDAREERWNRFLAEETNELSATEEEFMANAERQRQVLNGAYL
jgi:putative sterol carrier protein